MPPSLSGRGHSIISTSLTRRSDEGKLSSMDRSVSISDDGVARCAWAVAPGENRDYHDHEWGRPVVEDGPIFEKLCLEGFQAGLSWLTILRKREAFRRAFANFDIPTVAHFGDEDVTRLLADAGIVRNRGKIEATIGNARAVARLQADGDSLATLVWRYEPARAPAPRTLDDLAASTPESIALSKELRSRGLRFVGPTTVYAAMQSLGLVNDHMVGCHAREQVDAERAALARPR
jgi:DNA-3-methyladenine glycosylase I